MPQRLSSSHQDIRGGAFRDNTGRRQLSDSALVVPNGGNEGAKRDSDTVGREANLPREGSAGNLPVRRRIAYPCMIGRREAFDRSVRAHRGCEVASWQ